MKKYTKLFLQSLIETVLTIIYIGLWIAITFILKCYDAGFWGFALSYLGLFMIWIIYEICNAKDIDEDEILEHLKKNNNDDF